MTNLGSHKTWLNIKAIKICCHSLSFHQSKHLALAHNSVVPLVTIKARACHALTHFLAFMAVNHCTIIYACCLAVCRYYDLEVCRVTVKNMTSSMISLDDFLSLDSSQHFVVSINILFFQQIICLI